MKTVEMVLTGIAAAIVYAVASRATDGTWHFWLSFDIGAVVFLALSGFRARPVETPAASASTPSAEEKKKRKPGEPKSQRNEVAPRDDGESSQVRAPSREEPFVASEDTDLSGEDADLSGEDLPPPPLSPPDDPDMNVSPEALWEQACEMEPELDPELPVEDCENYMELVFGAAEGGCVPALARLGEIAFVRGDFVEAYFWTTLAHRRLELEDPSDTVGLDEIANMLRNIRREWAAAKQPPELENVYENFPEERGELGRAFLRLDAGIEVWQTREYIEQLAEKGNPDAALFVQWVN